MDHAVQKNPEWGIRKALLKWLYNNWSSWLDDWCSIQYTSGSYSTCKYLATPITRQFVDVEIQCEISNFLDSTRFVRKCSGVCGKMLSHQSKHYVYSIRDEFMQWPKKNHQNIAVHLQNIFFPDSSFKAAVICCELWNDVMGLIIYFLYSVSSFTYLLST